MGLKRRLFTAAAVVCAAAAVAAIGLSGKTVSQEQEETIFSKSKDTIYFWYTDEALTDYLGSAAVAYGENHDVRVIPVLTSGLEYLEEINKASIQSENPPDLYIISNDSLEKAFLAGLASPLEEEGWSEIKEEYPDAARLAVTYKNKTVGYPFYFETSSLLYNRTYLEDFARSLIEAERDAAEGEAAMAELEEGGPLEEGESGEGGAPEDGDMPDIDAEPGTGADDEAGMQELVAERVREILPSTIDDILNFANEYNAPEQVEAIFKWDVTDIFYNYFFVGDAIEIGGDAGWDDSRIDIYNVDAIKNMRVYQELNQFFSMDTSESDYDAILNEFMEGKIVFTMATTDAVFKLEHARDDGLFAYDYDIAMTPDIGEGRKTRSLSMTSCVVVNGYSDNKEAANDFAYFLTSQYNDILFARTGKVSAARDVDYGYEALDKFAQGYEKSISMPKMIETSNFWVKLEVVFSQIWNGADANEKLKELSEEMMEQVTGAPFEEEYLDVPVETEEEESGEEAEG